MFCLFFKVNMNNIKKLFFVSILMFSTTNIVEASYNFKTRHAVAVSSGILGTWLIYNFSNIKKNIFNKVISDAPKVFNNIEKFHGQYPYSCNFFAISFIVTMVCSGCCCSIISEAALDVVRDSIRALDDTMIAINSGSFADLIRVVEGSGPVNINVQQPPAATA